MARLVQGKIVLVTGGGSNIGRATALKLAREGVKVMIADYVQERGERIIKMIKDSGGSASFVQTDVSIASQVEAMVAKPSRFTGESMELSTTPASEARGPVPSIAAKTTSTASW